MMGECTGPYRVHGGNSRLPEMRIVGPGIFFFRKRMS